MFEGVRVAEEVLVASGDSEVDPLAVLGVVQGSLALEVVQQLLFLLVLVLEEGGVAGGEEGGGQQ